tara:strand:+ start:81 stop:527 length:447 start_codon:yes stop_codon:yes gene_type:complete
MFGVPLEVITLVGGSIAGFIFKYMAERAKDRQEQFKMLIKRHKAQEDAHNAAVERVPIDAGKWIRRIIVITILFGVVIAPFILALLGHPTIVEITEEQRSFLWGLIGGKEEIKFVELTGYILLPEVRQTLTTIVGFYFGAAVGRSPRR